MVKYVDADDTLFKRQRGPTNRYWEELKEGYRQDKVAVWEFDEQAAALKVRRGLSPLARHHRSSVRTAIVRMGDKWELRAHLKAQPDDMPAAPEQAE